jgi:hypothetical protein
MHPLVIDPKAVALDERVQPAIPPSRSLRRVDP